jgi:hypothetical protein
MSDVDLQSFVNMWNAELQQFHRNWQSRADDGAKRTNAQLWANGFLVRLDLTENHIEPGEPGTGSRKYDQIRMVILRDSRDPLADDTWGGGAPEPVTTRLWQSVRHEAETRWRDKDEAEITIEQVFSAVRAGLAHAIEEGID